MCSTIKHTACCLATDAIFSPCSMQQSPLVETQSVSISQRPDSNIDALDRTSRKNGPSFQGLRLPNTQSDSNQVDKLFTCRYTWSKCLSALTYFWSRRSASRAIRDRLPRTCAAPRIVTQHRRVIRVGKRYTSPLGSVCVVEVRNPRGPKC